MKLKKLKLHNFRGYTSEEFDLDEDMNVIIGRNDVGKSTVLDALEIFFNGDNKECQVKIEVDDFNVHCREEEKEIRIACCFDTEDKDVLIDSTNRTNLKEEYLLNEDGLLEIVKVWNCSKTKIGASDLKIYLCAHYPEVFDKPLVNLKISDLKKKLDNIKEDLPDYDKINKSKSADIRKALYNHYINDECTLKRTDIEVTKDEDAKKIWESIKTNLPLYFLFKSDRTNTDDDSEVQNPMKIATKNALTQMESDLDRIKEQVDKEVRKIGEKTIEKLRELDEDIAHNLRVDLKLKPWDSIFSFDLIGDDNIPLNKRGSGVRRLMLLSYFRAEAERICESSSSIKDVIYAIEEPETSQHPDYQKMIIESLITISQDKQHQIILTTHTPEIAKMVDIDQLIFIKKDESNNPCVVTDEDAKIRDIIDTLGILPDISSKLVICVEGDNDEYFLRNVNQDIEEYRKIINLNEEKIKIIPMCGSNLKCWVDKDYLSGSNVKEVHIYDNDRDDYKEKVKKINSSKDGRRIAWNTNRREIENYISPTLIEEELAVDLEDYKRDWENVDVPKVLVGKIKKDIKNEKQREMAIKDILDKSISKKINKQYLDEIGAFDEIEDWFKKIKSAYEK